MGISEGNEKEAAQYLLNYLTSLLDCERLTFEQTEYLSRALYHVSLFAQSVGSYKFGKELLFDASELAKLVTDKELTLKIEQALIAITSHVEGMQLLRPNLTHTAEAGNGLPVSPISKLASKGIENKSPILADESSFSDWDDEFASSSEEKVVFKKPMNSPQQDKPTKGTYGKHSHSLLWNDTSQKISVSHYQLLPKDQVKTIK